MAENKTYNDSPTFIPARLESSVHGLNPVADAKDIYDINAGAWQKDINEQSVGYRKEIDELVAAQTPLSLSVSPTLIEAGVSTNISIAAAADLDDPDEVCASIQIFRGSTLILEGTDVRSKTGTDSYQPATNGTTKYKAVFDIRGNEKPKEVNVTAHFPIYYGLGANADAVGGVASKKVLKSSPSGTYSGTANANGQHFYIIVPDYMPTLTVFTMGGAPFVMEAPVQATYNGVVYKVYESGESYNNGTKITVTAS